MNKTEVTCSKQEVEGTTLPKETLKQILIYSNQVLRSYAENVLPKIEKSGIRKCNALLGNLEKKKRCSRINKLYNLVKKLYSQPLAQSIACLENCQGCIRAQLQIRYEVLRSLHGLPTRDVSGQIAQVVLPVYLRLHSAARARLALDLQFVLQLLSLYRGIWLQLRALVLHKIWIHPNESVVPLANVAILHGGYSAVSSLVDLGAARLRLLLHDDSCPSRVPREDMGLLPLVKNDVAGRALRRGPAVVSAQARLHRLPDLDRQPSDVRAGASAPAVFR